MNKLTLRQISGFGIVLCLLYVVLAYAFYAGVASRALGANDFFSRWMGARALFLNGQNPYSDAVTRQIQMGMYGRLARPDEDQVAFAYPLYAAFFVLPFIPMPYAVAESFWIALLIVAVVGAGIALARLFDFRLSPIGFLGYVVFILSFYPVLRGIFLGQFTLWVFASFAFGLILLEQRRDEIAGWVLAVGSVKPHVAVLALAVILAWGIAQRRWRLVRGWLSAMALLVLLATLLLPDWLSEFIGAVGAYQNYIQIGAPIQALSELALPSEQAGFVAALLSIFWLGAVGYQLMRTIGADLAGVLPTIELAMLVTTLAMLRTATTDQSMLLIFWIHWFSRFARGGWRWRVVLIGCGVVAIPWIVFLSTLRGNQEAPIATTTSALLTLIAYVLVYRRDWIPHRTRTVEDAST